MPYYCVNRNAQPSSGDHEVHDLAIGRDKGCLPAALNQVDLGYHSNCQSAVTAAKRTYPSSDGCKRCVPACHTS